MTNSQATLLDELEAIDDILLNGDSTSEQEARGLELVTLANAAPKLLNSLEYFFNIMHEYESSLEKGYVEYALEQAHEAIAEAKGE